MQTYEYAKTIAAYYAYWDFGEDINLDNEATTRRVWKYLSTKKEFDKIRKMPEEWQRHEYLHLCIADYFSMFEPVYKTKEGK
jgi:hypothetical protein